MQTKKKNKIASNCSNNKSKRNNKKLPIQAETEGSKQGDRQEEQVNRPRNLLVLDATQPFTFSFCGSFGINRSITVHQTPDEDCWPGGALWDLGVLLAEVLVLLTGGKDIISSTMMTGGNGSSSRGKTTTKKYVPCTKLSTRLGDIQDEWKHSVLERGVGPIVVLELGCGVGLTGLVATAALGSTTTTILTDLSVVIDKVTQPNVIQNTIVAATQTKRTTSKLTTGMTGPTTTTNIHHRTINKAGGKVFAIPLCWGNQDDEEVVSALLKDISLSSSSTCCSGQKKKKKKKKKEIGQEEEGEHSMLQQKQEQQQRNRCIPDLILIGDVAYQHRPGAPSHFDALMSTLHKFVDEHTIVIFGTRLRMPASIDLLNLFLEHFHEILAPPIQAQELDPSFENTKHNMTIHLLKKKKKKKQSNIAQEM